ncbi:hypothetical protein Lal_00019165 [Lupinus albus]|nr:hypothetical protein Lal_00019165 [Lupinus albus]
MGEHDEEERYEEEGNGVDPYPHDSKTHKHASRDRDYDRDSSRSSREKEKEREKGREKDRKREKERDRDHRHRDHRDRREREKGRDKNDDDDDYYRRRDFDRRKDYDREDRHKRRSRSRSSSPSRGRSQHRSRSRSKSKVFLSMRLHFIFAMLTLFTHSKRISGFDMAPPPSAILAGASTITAHATEAKKALEVETYIIVPLDNYEFALRCNVPAFAGQITGPNPAIPAVFQNMFPLATSQPFSALPVMPVQAMTQQATRHARRVYVGGLPPTANEQSVATFFSQVMANIGGNTAGPGDAVVNVYINHDKKFAFVEMRSVEEASNAMALDGIIFEGAPVKVRRPTDYNPSLAATLGPSQPNPNLNLAAVGLIPGSAGGLEGPDRIFVGGVPYYFTENQIRELLETFGPLRGFDLVKDRETGNSKGYAFCVYQDLAVTDIACAALNGIKMGDKTLTVRRANQGANQPKPEQENVLMHAQQQIALQKLMFQPTLVATKVVCLTQAVSPDELKEDEDYEEIIEDMRQECSKFGTLVNVVIPRPQPNGELTAGVGKVFLEYADTDGATKAFTGLNGRKFGGNQVQAVFYPENKFAQGDYEG